ncbi:MAG TPA: C-GCAxxG-C-C family (seleno)protein [Bacillota bacterium]|nr:C-GCAxxG-C-C family (seleno)protein [Bacillota bacterium]
MSLQGNFSEQESGLDNSLGRQAEQLFRQGYNCCESIIKASNAVFNLGLPDNIYLLGRFFRQGLGSGCICGALAGGTMILGYMSGESKDAKQVAERFRSQFIQHFGSTCCREIRKQQSITERYRKTGCRRITQVAASLVQELCGGETDQGVQNS